MGFDLQAHQELRRLSYTVNCLVRDFCCKAKRCIGISNTGNPNLFLNQQGDWVTGGGGDIQTLLGSLPIYDSVATALADGVTYGSWFFNTLTNTVSKAWNSISGYFALKSKIDFTNNGGDDWNASFFITPQTGVPQLPVGVTVDSYNYDIVFWLAGVETHLDAGNKTADYSFNTTGNGAGVYQLRCDYVLSNGNTLGISSLILVDNAGNILKRIDNNGYTVNSVIGLDIDITIDLVLFNYSNSRLFSTFNGIIPTSVTNIGLTNTATITTNTGDIMILGTIGLDSSWTTDFAGDFYTNVPFLIV